MNSRITSDGAHRRSHTAVAVTVCSVIAAAAVVAGLLVVGAGSEESTRAAARSNAEGSRNALAQTEDKSASTFASTVGALSAGRSLSPRAASLVSVVTGVLSDTTVAQLTADRAALDSVVGSVADTGWIDIASGQRRALWGGPADVDLPAVSEHATTAELASYAAVAAARNEDRTKTVTDDAAQLRLVSDGIAKVDGTINVLARSAVSSAKALVKASPSAAQSTRRAALRAANRVRNAEDQITALTEYAAAAKAVRASHTKVEGMKAVAAAEAKAVAKAKAEAAATAAAAAAKVAAEVEAKRLADEAAAVEAKRVADEAAAKLTEPKITPTPSPSPTATPSPTPAPGDNPPPTETLPAG